MVSDQIINNILTSTTFLCLSQGILSWISRWHGIFVRSYVALVPIKTLLVSSLNHIQDKLLVYAAYRSSYSNTLSNCRNIEEEDNIPLLILIILFLIYKLSRINTPVIITNDIGNGTNIEMAMLMPNDIPIHIIWLKRNCLLLLALMFHSPFFFKW